MNGLFPPPLPDGFSYRDEFLTPAEERMLITAIDGVELAPFRFQG